MKVGFGSTTAGSWRPNGADTEVIGPSAQRVDDAQRHAGAIGFERLAGAMLPAHRRRPGVSLPGMEMRAELGVAVALTRVKRSLRDDRPRLFLAAQLSKSAGRTCRSSWRAVLPSYRSQPIRRKSRSLNPSFNTTSSELHRRDEQRRPLSSRGAAFTSAANSRKAPLPDDRGARDPSRVWHPISERSLPTL